VFGSHGITSAQLVHLTSVKTLEDFDGRSEEGNVPAKKKIVKKAPAKKTAAKKPAKKSKKKAA
jgi:hypothetical protein